MDQSIVILIATPAYGNHVTTPYLTSMIDLCRAFERAAPRIHYDVMLHSHALVAQSRNIFASKFLETPDYTHLLMIDADMGFSADLVMRMLRLDRGVCAASYPKRILDLRAVVENARKAREDESPDTIIARSYEFVCEGDLVSEAAENGGRRLELVDGFVRATAAGAGVMLISRAAMNTMFASLPELRSPHLPGGPVKLKEYFFQPFNEIVTEGGITLSEDISFCRRWVEVCGGDIWVNTDTLMTHQGPFPHQARFMDKLITAPNDP